MRHPHVLRAYSGRTFGSQAFPSSPVLTKPLDESELADALRRLVILN